MLYDPGRISYRKLLEVFWRPTTGCAAPRRDSTPPHLRRRGGTDREARAFLEEKARKGQRPRTRVVPLGPVHPAEPYHQKYLLRQVSGLYGPLVQRFPDERAFWLSASALRVNAFLGGHGEDLFEATLPLLGLDREAQDLLRRLIRRALNPVPATKRPGGPNPPGRFVYRVRENRAPPPEAPRTVPGGR